MFHKAESNFFSSSKNVWIQETFFYFLPVVVIVHIYRIYLSIYMPQKRIYLSISSIYSFFVARPTCSEEDKTKDFNLKDLASQGFKDVSGLERNPNVSIAMHEVGCFSEWNFKTTNKYQTFGNASHETHSLIIIREVLILKYWIFIAPWRCISWYSLATGILPLGQYFLI